MNMGYFKCPECTSMAEFEKMGPYRARCIACGSVVKNTELKIEKGRYDADAT